MSVQAFAFFQFGRDTYTAESVTWQGSGDIAIEVNHQLQSCFGFGLSGFFRCSNGNGSEDYSVVVTAVELVSAGTSLEIDKVTFRQASNSLLLVEDDGIKDTRSQKFDPGSWQQVQANLKIDVTENALQLAQPGLYSGRIDMLGEETEGFFSSQDTTRFDFDVSVPFRTRISGLTDIGLGTLADDGTATSSWRSFCIYTQGGVNFRLTARGQRTEFSLAQNSTLIDYQLFMKSSQESGEGELLVPGQNYSQWAGSINQECTGGDNMQLKVTVPATSNALSKPAGVYSDTITITVQAV